MSDTDTDTDTDSSALPAALMLNPVEARILGCLVEKEGVSPDTYPLTVNALVAACNQKTSREPVMNLSVGEVGHALRQLAERELVKREFGARVERWAHCMDEAYHLTSRRRGLLAVLLLRGPQTLAELHTRVERIASLPGVEHVRDELERLAERDPPLVSCLGRAPGQREDRYMHLLCGAVDREAWMARQASEGGQEGAPGLSERIAELERRLDELEARLRGDGD